VVRLALNLDTSHVHRLARSPMKGLIELVWNAIDADATRIDVRILRSDLGGVHGFVVTDDGHGIDPSVAQAQYAKLGGSWKATAARSPSGRPLHGRHGQGRFRPFGRGGFIEWRTVAATDDGHVQTTLRIAASDMQHCDVEGPLPVDAPTGTEVLVDGLNQPVTDFDDDRAIDRLIVAFALPIEAYGLRITFEGQVLNPNSLQAARETFELPEVNDQPARLTVIEWNRNIDRALYLCDGEGVALEEIEAGIHAPGFDFTGYLSWPGFNDATTELATIELHSGPARRAVDLGRDFLRTHFRARAKERRQRTVRDWTEEGVYPFRSAPTTAAERAARDTFDLVALQAASVINTSPIEGRRLSLHLLREALEKDPGSLHRVLTEVLALPGEDIDALADLLTRTPLASVIAASRAITDRLDFLAGLARLTTDPGWYRLVRERAQLHKILNGETWIFGEEYALALSDRSLTQVLRQHIAYLERAAPIDPDGEGDELEPVDGEIVDASGRRRIVDLMFSRSIERNEDERQHLVVELKRPSVTVGPKELQQIKDYAFAVADNHRFDKLRTRWEFWVVSTSVRGTADEERRQDPDYLGLVGRYRGDRIRIWVKTWSEILHSAEHRLKFVRRGLGYDPSEEQALAYLRREHEELLPEELQEQPVRTGTS
jgi:hypothetical protein